MNPAAQPFYFGPDDRRLFGWLHRTTRPANVGLLICNPFGFEEVCAHRALRHLAEAAATAGIPALRFDDYGCGDSAGSELEGGHFDSRLASVHEAADSLKRNAGVERVVLLGVRLGAVFATLAALQRRDIAGLIAIAPVVRGRAYLRELRVLGSATAQGERAPLPDGMLESAGFVMTAETVGALERVDLKALGAPPAASVLIVERDDLPSSDGWDEVLRGLGAVVQVGAWPGYRDLMTDPQQAVVPAAMVDGVLGWMGELLSGSTASERRSSPVPLPDQACFDVDGGKVCERRVIVDRGGARLFGILTTPWAESASTPAPGAGILMLNSGSVHHIGPNRLWVQLARSWASRGFQVLRVDLSGIADSRPRDGAQENVVYSDCAVDDVRQAFEFMREDLGVTDCRLLGLCSGAYHAFKAAVAGAPATAAVMINPLTFFWKPGTPLNPDLVAYELIELTSKYKGKMFSLDPWRRLVRGQLDLRMILSAVLGRGIQALSNATRNVARAIGWRLRDDLPSELQQACRSGTQLHFVFAAADPGLRLLQEGSGRALERLRGRGHLTLDLIADADHTFTGFESRQRLVQLLNRLVLDGPDAHRQAEPASRSGVRLSPPTAETS